MKTPGFPQLVRSQYARCAAAAAWSLTVAILILAGSSLSGADGREQQLAKSELLANRATVLANASAYARAGDVATAEAWLATLVAVEKATARWHATMATQWTHVVIGLSKEGDGKAVEAAATRAVQHLGEADRMATDDATRARARQSAGFLFERFLGDPESAKASYRAALAVAPAMASAAGKLARIETAEREAQRRITTNQR